MKTQVFRIKSVARAFRCWIGCVVFVIASMVTQVVSAETPAEKARRLVQESLVAESKGLESERRNRLEEAEREQTNEPSVRWRQGQVRVGKEWQSVHSVASVLKKSKVLAKYHQLRDASSLSLESQIQLAAFCDKNRLHEAAIAHWMAVLEFDPNHEYTRMKLGHQCVEGQWYTIRELEMENAKSRRVADALRTEADHLCRIANRLARQSMSVKEACDAILADAELDSIPAWEMYLSSAHGPGASAVVQALSAMQQPESTLSLARHAVWAEDPAVRWQAIDSLQGRDEYAFVPALLSELQGPWTNARQVTFAEGNRVVFRYSLVSETQDKQILKIFDDVYFLAGDLAFAERLARRTAGAASIQSDYARNQINELINQRNQKIVTALQHITGESDIGTPQAWWSWWDDRVEVYSSEDKPYDTAYDYRGSTVEGPVVAIPPVRLATSNSRQPTRVIKDCLAAGTPILTNRGPVAIERIRMGDAVWSKDSETGEIKLQPVLRTTVREPGHLIRITLTDIQNEEAVLRASGGHPFFVSGSGWVRARALEPGMVLHGLEGTSVVKSVEVEEKLTRTYNLVVHDFHSYFAGTNAVLSHDNSMVTPARTPVPGLVLAAGSQ